MQCTIFNVFYCLFNDLKHHFCTLPVFNVLYLGCNDCEPNWMKKSFPVISSLKHHVKLFLTVIQLLWDFLCQLYLLQCPYLCHSLILMEFAASLCPLFDDYEATENLIQRNLLAYSVSILRTSEMVGLSLSTPSRITYPFPLGSSIAKRSS